MSYLNESDPAYLEPFAPVYRTIFYDFSSPSGAAAVGTHAPTHARATHVANGGRTLPPPQQVQECCLV